MFEYEQKLINEGYEIVVGVDEAGRGPLAGPVVAAAVALKENNFTSKITDSKKISQRLREKAFCEIYDNAYVGVGIMNELVIDSNNILKATFMAMSTAIRQLVCQLPDSISKKQNFENNIMLLIDGNMFKSDLSYRYETVIKGDEKVSSISCASIIAKVTRDRILYAYDKIYPQYGFKGHKGYPTKAHKEAIKQFGPSIIHRRSFAGVIQ